MEEIKLVIWDLDETFWEGTLSEGNVIAVPQNINAVIELAKRGIISSICSKNDFKKAKEILQEMIIWDYVVFPSIDWTPKGQRIRLIIEECHLRPSNVLFVDDNLGNRMEAEHYNPGINTIYVSGFYGLMGTGEFAGKPDPEMKRLKSYKLLENKTKDEGTYSDNIAFLSQSNIMINYIYDTWTYRDRILELITRTNQLNYTKKRLSSDQLDNLLTDKELENVCVHVIDKYGDYGICGFYTYSKTDHKLLNFLFSCRIMNMGIDNYVYLKLNKPNISVIEPVANRLDQYDEITWIKESSLEKAKNVDEKIKTALRKRLLILGGCDLRQMGHYLNKDRYDIIEEFNYPNQYNAPIHRDHIVYIRQGHSDEQLKKEISSLQYLDSRMFETKLFTNDYDVLVYSVLMNYTQNLYRHREKGYLVTWGGYERDVVEGMINQNIPTDFALNFPNEFEKIGQQTEEDFKNDLEWLLSTIKKPVIFINGAEIEGIIHKKEPTSYVRHQKMNKVLDEFVREHADRCQILDMREIVKERNDCKDNIRHYQRVIYVKMAEKLMSMLEGNKMEISRISRFISDMSILKERVLRRCHVILR
jgi:FkbH-like protein